MYVYLSSSYVKLTPAVSTVVGHCYVGHSEHIIIQTHNIKC